MPLLTAALSVSLSVRLVSHTRTVHDIEMRLHHGIAQSFQFLEAKFHDSEFRCSPPTSVLKKSTPIIVESAELTNNLQ